MMTLPISTRRIARLADCSVCQVHGAIYRGKLDPPQKTEGGDFAWSEADVERIRRAVAEDRRRKHPEAVTPGAGH